MKTPAVPAPRPGGPYRVCFVCTGNICRSPMAEVVLGHLARQHRAGFADRLVITSGGTGPWHEGEPMDKRARDALDDRGYPPSRHVAHQVTSKELATLDLVVALDRRHHETLRGLARGSLEGRLVLLRSFDPTSGGALDVPDPYYGDARDFAACLALVEAGCQGLVSALVATLEDASTQGG